jgi:DNA-binding transcriptional LysR family regulator
LTQSFGLDAQRQTGRRPAYRDHGERSSHAFAFLLSQFHHNYPNVQIELVTGTSGALIDKVHRLEIEAAFVAEPVIATGLESMELAPYHAIVACVAAGAGIAIVPHALSGTMRVENEVNISMLPQRFARASACLV